MLSILNGPNFLFSEWAPRWSSWKKYYTILYFYKRIRYKWLPDRRAHFSSFVLITLMVGLIDMDPLRGEAMICSIFMCFL